MKGPQLLSSASGRIRSRMGGCFLGSHAVFRGHDLHRDLKDMDWLELHLFGITGRRFSREQLRVSLDLPGRKLHVRVCGGPSGTVAFSV